MRHAKEENNSGDSFGLRDTLVWCGIPIIIGAADTHFPARILRIPSGIHGMNTIDQVTV